MTTQESRIISGIQPTNRLTLGNYLGAIKNWVRLQDQYQCYFMAVNQHAITVRQSPESMRENTLYALAMYMAAGIDYKKHTLFVQSDVPEHSQLAWILMCHTYMGEMSRMTQFKDKSSQAGANIPAGLFAYPVLMAADILLYDVSLVPVGHDQKQHVELTRDLAQRMNHIYGDDTFVVPEAFIPQVAARVMDLQDPNKKMSKSASSDLGVIFLNDSSKTIEKKLKKATTDSDTVIAYDKSQKPGVSNLLDIQSAITGQSIDELVSHYKDKMYGHLKIDTANLVIEELIPLQEKAAEYLSDKAELMRILQEGAQKAREQAFHTLSRLHRRLGFNLF